MMLTKSIIYNVTTATDKILVERHKLMRADSEPEKLICDDDMFIMNLIICGWLCSTRALRHIKS